MTASDFRTLGPDWVYTLADALKEVERQERLVTGARQELAKAQCAVAFAESQLFESKIALDKHIDQGEDCLAHQRVRS
jgi:hypothetical protein